MTISPSTITFSKHISHVFTGLLHHWSTFQQERQRKANVHKVEIPHPYSSQRATEPPKWLHISSLHLEATLWTAALIYFLQKSIGKADWAWGLSSLSRLRYEASRSNVSFALAWWTTWSVNSINLSQVGSLQFISFFSLSVFALLFLLLSLSRSTEGGDIYRD